MITSNTNPSATCCATCALVIVEQTHRWAYGIFNDVIAAGLGVKLQEFQKAKQEDGADAAIRKAGG